MAEFFFALKEKRKIAEETMAFVLDTKGIEFKFKAGQHADFTMQNPPFSDWKGKTRTFSMAGSPLLKGSIMFATRMRDSAFKKSLKAIPEGTELKVSEPSGEFVLHEDSSRPAVFLAGGIGITPMRSIIETAALEKSPCKLFLFYSNKSPESTAFLQDFEKFAQENRNFHFFPTITDSEGKGWKYLKGKIDFAMIEKNLQKAELEKAVYYISGPASMVEAFYKMLKSNGVKDTSIRTEEFSGY